MMNRLFAAAGVAATAISVAASPASASPADAKGTVTHCIIDSNGASTCGSPQQMASRTAALPLLVAVHDLTNYGGEYRAFYAASCSEGTGDVDYSFDLGFMSGRGSSVTKGANGNCNWQLVGPNGGRSTWVEGSRANLANLGDGWSNRAVRIRLT